MKKGLLSIQMYGAIFRGGIIYKYIKWQESQVNLHLPCFELGLSAYASTV